MLNRAAHAKSHLLLPIAALLSFGCADDPGWSIRDVDPAIVQDVFDEWCSRSGRCERVDQQSEVFIAFADLPTNVRGKYRHEGSEPVCVEIDRGMVDNPIAVRRILLHELGHHIRGPKHLPPGNVMAEWMFDDPQHLTDDDVDIPDVGEWMGESVE
jgi:hypothetical protein